MAMLGLGFAFWNEMNGVDDDDNEIVHFVRLPDGSVSIEKIRPTCTLDVLIISGPAENETSMSSETIVLKLIPSNFVRTVNVPDMKLFVAK